jgi:hypothetical protein
MSASTRIVITGFLTAGIAMCSLPWTAPERVEGPLMTESFETSAPHRRVRVWFGANPIADHTAVADEAAQYEEAMRRRFACLRVTSEPVLVTSATAPERSR